MVARNQPKLREGDADRWRGFVHAGGAVFSFAGCLNYRSSQLLLLSQENPPVTDVQQAERVDAKL